jgi:hypothetical protein
LLEGDIALRKKLDDAAAAAGRTPRDLGVLWAKAFDVVSGPEEAASNRQKILDSIPEQMGVVFLSQWWGRDGYRLDPQRTVHDTIAEVKELGVGPNWSYIDNAVANTDPSDDRRIRAPLGGPRYRRDRHAGADRGHDGGGASCAGRQWRLHDRL